MQFRLKFALSHLLISMGLVSIVAYFTYKVWYVPPLDDAVGVGVIFWMVALVDVVTGPILTFLVADKKKKSLTKDLAIIAFVQVLALGYGAWVIAHARPIWIVFNADRFDLVQAQDIDYRFEKDANPEFLGGNWSGPKWAASKNPADLKKQNDLVLESSVGGSDLPQRIDLYVSIDGEWRSIVANSRPMKDLALYNPAEKIRGQLIGQGEANAWLPLMARKTPMVVLIKKEAKKVISIVNLNPWS